MKRIFLGANDEIQPKTMLSIRSCRTGPGTALVSASATISVEVPKKSLVWQHFVELDGGNVQCTICNNKVQVSGNTSNLHTHLSRHHNIVMPKNTNERKHELVPPARQPPPSAEVAAETTTAWLQPPTLHRSTTATSSRSTQQTDDATSLVDRQSSAELVYVKTRFCLNYIPHYLFVQLHGYETRSRCEFSTRGQKGGNDKNLLKSIFIDIASVSVNLYIDLGLARIRKPRIAAAWTPSARLQWLMFIFFSARELDVKSKSRRAPRIGAVSQPRWDRRHFSATTQAAAPTTAASAAPSRAVRAALYKPARWAAARIRSWALALSTSPGPSGEVRHSYLESPRPKRRVLSRVPGVYTNLSHFQSQGCWLDRDKSFNKELIRFFTKQFFYFLLPSKSPRPFYIKKLHQRPLGGAAPTPTSHVCPPALKVSATSSLSHSTSVAQRVQPGPSGRSSPTRPTRDRQRLGDYEGSKTKHKLGPEGNCKRVYSDNEAFKEDISSTASEVVYSDTQHLPGEMLKTSTPNKLAAAQGVVVRAVAVVQGVLQVLLLELSLCVTMIATVIAVQNHWMRAWSYLLERHIQQDTEPDPAQDGQLSTLRKEFLLVTSRKLQENITLRTGDCDITSVPFIRYLGVYIDERQRFYQHLLAVTKSLRWRALCSVCCPMLGALGASNAGSMSVLSTWFFFTMFRRGRMLVRRGCRKETEMVWGRTPEPRGHQRHQGQPSDRLLEGSRSDELMSTCGLTQWTMSLRNEELTTIVTRPQARAALWPGRSPRTADDKNPPAQPQSLRGCPGQAAIWVHGGIPVQERPVRVHPYFAWARIGGIFFFQRLRSTKTL
ncbi:unnamed protein product [Trichogramma brassicae]|uniref:BED-type domain-containing protein n=1 Tax=Trichogramma brassicae TaxID=86971 RepID=A0A6H5IP40_9HYME|nr:unnamed protein product [Trichogramma brassicae]